MLKIKNSGCYSLKYFLEINFGTLEDHPSGSIEGACSKHSYRNSDNYLLIYELPKMNNKWEDWNTHSSMMWKVHSDISEK